MDLEGQPFVGVDDRYQHHDQPLKIAIVGAAESSRHLAPFGDPSWTIWMTSPSNMGLGRFDQWFELHDMARMARDPSFTPYLHWLTEKPVFLQEQDARFPQGRVFPKDDLVKRFGPYFFTSSIALMLAHAITRQPETIGLWGIDMSAATEYAQQRPSCHYFIEKAKGAGIKVLVPQESDLLCPPAIYGYGEASHMWRKLEARRIELTERRNAAIAARDQAERVILTMDGALDDNAYVMRTWI